MHDIQEELFIPKIDLNKQSHFFKILMLDENKPYREILKNWATGFFDRDGKFVKEFQNTFNSSFWELYIYAVLKKLGYHINFNYFSPDFVCEDIVFEATISNISDTYRAEFAKKYILSQDEYNTISIKSLYA